MRPFRFPLNSSQPLATTHISRESRLAALSPWRRCWSRRAYIAITIYFSAGWHRFRLRIELRDFAFMLASHYATPASVNYHHTILRHTTLSHRFTPKIPIPHLISDTPGFLISASFSFYHFQRDDKFFSPAATPPPHDDIIDSRLRH